MSHRVASDLFTKKIHLCIPFEAVDGMFLQPESPPPDSVSPLLSPA